MKKRLVLLSLILCSIFGFFACSKDPYASMTIESSANDVVITMEEKYINGTKEYVVEPYEFYVTIDGVSSDVSKDIEVSGGEGLVTVEAKRVKSDKIKITVTPISYQKTGPFTLNIRTVEGNKTLDVKFNLNLKINDFNFKEEELKVVSKGGEINLNDIEKYIKFTPEATNQRYIEYEVVTPDGGVVPGRDGVYTYDGNGTYAEIVNGVLKAYKTNSAGEPVVYPQLTKSVSSGDSELDETYQCITLKAKYVGPNKDEVRIADKYIDIEVVEDCSDIRLFMNYQQNTNGVGSEFDGFFELERNSGGEYEVVLLDPLYKYGMSLPTYYIERDLIFNFGEYQLGYDPENYRVVSKQVLDTEDLPITLTGVEGENVENNQFKVLAQHSGVYSHVFRIEHKEYPEIVNAEVVVNFYVEDLPTDIRINDNEVQDNYKVYDFYVGGYYGAEFKVDLNNNHGDFEYFVFVKDAGVAGFLKLFKSTGAGDQVLGILENVAGEDVVKSSVEGEEVTRFKDLETFYLKHSFESLPEEPIELCIGIEFNVAGDNYSEEVLGGYFKKAIMYTSITLIPQKGIRDITFTQSKYVIALDDTILTDNILDDTGLKLFELPEGQTFDSAIANNGLEYDKKLITVYPIQDGNITSFYLKANDKFNVGKTDIVVKTKNGIVRKVAVETFIPTAYANSEDMPMGISVDNSQILYYMSDPEDHNREYYVYGKDGTVWSENTYKTVDTLFMLKGNSADIRFYDYILASEVNGGIENKFIIPVDITSLISVQFNFKEYVSYSNGILTAKEITTDINLPVIMEVTYFGGVLADEDNDGIFEYKTVIKQHEIKIYIYVPLQGVQIKNEKDTTIYLDDSLGCYSKELSSHTIVSDFIPNEKRLGAEWNSSNIWSDPLVGNNDKPVTLFYDWYKVKDSIIYINDTTPLVIKSFFGNNEYVVKYRDLFTVEDKIPGSTGDEYNLTVKCVVGEDFLKWLRGAGGYSSQIDYILKNKIFNNDIYLKINVYIRQFFKLQNINEVSIKAEYAAKITDYNMDVFDDGIYFENRGGVLDTAEYRIPFVIESGFNAPDKTFRAILNTFSVCDVDIEYSPSGNSGEIVIKGENTFGTSYITITPNDNIKSHNAETGVYTFFNNNLTQTIRVKIANGTISDPFEIRTVEDFERMQNDIAQGKNYHYILTRNLNLSKTEILSVSSKNPFALSGKHTYSRNGKEIVKYSNLYNVNIKKDIELDSDLDTYVGLFGVLTNNVSIGNIGIINANINLNVTGSGNLYVGVLAGKTTGVKITNSTFNGVVRINNTATNSNNYIGGAVGYIDNNTIKGLSGSYYAEMSTSKDNINVMFDIQDVENSTNTYEIGGYAGVINNTALNDVSVVSTIRTDNVNGNIGGVVANNNNASLTNIESYPKINVINGNTNIGGVVGLSRGTTILDSIRVYLIKNNSAKSWTDTCDILVNTTGIVNVGGLVGVVDGEDIDETTISYSYLRSFYNYIISDNYKGSVYVNAPVGNVGGLVGNNQFKTTISKSYFDGDISAIANLKVGQLVGSFVDDTLALTDSYAIGYLQKIDSKGNLLSVQNVDNNFGLIGGLSFIQGQDLVFSSNTSATIENVYSVVVNSVVIDDPIYYLGEGNIVSGFIGDDLFAEKYSLVNLDDLGNKLFNDELGYSIKTTSNNIENPTWLWVAKLNTFNNIAMPVLVDKNNKAMYDVLPESIVVSRINQVDGFFDVTDVASDYKQVLMFINIDNNGRVVNEPFEIKEQDGHITIVFNGSIVFEDYINVKNDIVIKEKSNTETPVLSIEGNKVYPITEGISTITISCAYDSSVYTKIIVKVVKGISDFEVYDETTFGTKVRMSEENLNVYIDEETTFSINNTYGDYLPLSKTIYKLELVSGSNVININNKTISVGTPLYLNTNTFVVKGLIAGSAKIKITPLIPLDGLSDNNFDCSNLISGGIVTALSKVYTISSNKKTMAIRFTEKPESLTFRSVSEFSLEVETSNFTKNGSTYSLDEIIYVKLSNGEVLSIDLTDNKTWSIDYQLVNIKFTGYTVEESSEYPNCVIFVINGYAELDIEHYRSFAERYNLERLVYDFTFIPESNYFNGIIINENITDSLNISIKPTQLKSIETNYYSKGELLGEIDGFNGAAENESNYIIPGKYGLLKITLDEEFTNSSYITITMSNSFKGYITLDQVAGIVEKDENNNLLPYGNISGYENVSSSKYYPINHPTEHGLQLVKVSVNNLDLNYFNKTYYVKVYMNREYASLNTDRVEFFIRSYDADGNEYEVAGYKKTLLIKELPSISVKVDNEVSANLGLGTRKPLEIALKGVENNITIQNSSSGNIQILEENGATVEVLDVNYINSGKKYYIYADLNSSDYTSLFDSYELTFRTVHFIENMIEITTCKLNIDVVDFEIESIRMAGSINDKITIKQGQFYNIETEVKARELYDNGNEYIDDYQSEIDDKVSVIQKIMSGITEGEVTGNLNLKYLKSTVNNKDIYEYFTISTDNDYIGLRIYEETNGDSNYLIKGMFVNSEDTLVRLKLLFLYSYESGELTHEEEGILGYEVDFSVYVEDVSSEEVPMPIETQEQLLRYSKMSGDYILVNNIELVNWIPQEAVFDSLDGNGYTIKVKSFDLNGSQNTSQADIGIFSSVSEKTLLKNITVDVGELLIGENDVEANIKALANSTKDSYSYDTSINAAYTNTVNFGVLAGVNKGSITNAKIINTNSDEKYLHIVTNLGYIEGQSVNANIGALVGINASTGAITNSFVGLNISTTNSDGVATIKGVASPSSAILDNITDNLQNINTYDFTIAGSNKLGGVVSENNGVISNTYAKGLGIYNTYPAVGDSKTGGFVAVNSNIITSSFVEGSNISSYRATDEKEVIESTGNVGGFVYENSGSISNAYSNVYLITESSFVGGFVYNNSGSILNAYTTTVNSKNLAHGQFTGVDNNGRTILNTGNYTNCYYLVLNTGEHVNKNEDAIAIEDLTEGRDSINNKATWKGYSFASEENEDGIWKLVNGYTPRLVNVFYDTISFRRIVDKLEDEEDSGNNQYVYEYVGNNIGSRYNPLLINSVDEFHKKIIDYAVDVQIGNSQVRVFGAYENANSEASLRSIIKHVRLIRNLDFNNKVLSAFKGYYLQNTIFAGVLDGNGMSISNLNISDARSNQNFGLFSQIGLYLPGESIGNAIVKNLDISIATYSGTDVQNAGILAGSIVNANIINVSIDGGNVEVKGINTAGGLAGVIRAEGTSQVSLFDVTVENIKVKATNGSLTTEITKDTKELSNGTYKSFSVPDQNGIHGTANSVSFKSLNSIKTTNFNLLNQVSYAGAVAGVIKANNYTDESRTFDPSVSTETTGDENTDVINSSINNIIVKGNIAINNADNAGGLFGYIGENTVIKNSKFIIGGTQLIKGKNYVGGIVGENYGVIDECYIALEDAEQEKHDNTLNKIDVTFGNYLLFDMKEENYYTVAIGGIAGYSNGGMIIDSYSKANIIKSNAYIVGGIVGYTEGYNYLENAYNSSVLYGKHVIGGIVGLHLDTTGTDKLHLRNVISLTNWNVKTNDIDIKNIITSRLYDNQKELYSYDNGNGDVGYNYFYVIMPEIGNLQMIKASDQSTATSYNPQSYIGSVIGSLKVQTGSTYKKLVSLSDVTDTLNHSKVNSATLGVYSYEGTIESGKKVDSYANTFEFTNSLGVKMNMYSYRRVFDSKNNNLDFTIENYSEEYKFEEIFEYQSYIQDLIGEFYYKYGNSSAKSSNKFDSFASAENRNIWYIKTYLPEFSYNVNKSVYKVTTSDELKESFDIGLSGVDYTFDESLSNITIETSNTGIQFVRPVRSNFKGVEGVTSINIGSTGSLLGAIFNSISGASFENITFNIKAKQIAYSTSSSSYGLFANVIENSKIKNCTFNIEVVESLDLTGLNGDINNLGLLFGQMNNTIFEGNTVVFKVGDVTLNKDIENFGLFAGYTNRSTIRNNSFDIDEDELQITMSGGQDVSEVIKTKNIAGIIGEFNYSTYSSNTYNDKNDKLVFIDNSILPINVAGVIGYSNNSTISSISSAVVLNQTVNGVKDEVNTGIILGKGYATTLDNVNTTGSLTVSTGTVVVEKLNTGAIVGYADTGVSLDSTYSKSNISVIGKSDSMSVGGLVGFAYEMVEIGGSYSSGTIDVNNNQEGKEVNSVVVYAITNIGGILGTSSVFTEIIDVYSIATLKFNGNGKDKNKASIGGLVGYNANEIIVENFAALNNFTDIVGSGNINVSGVVGLNSGLFKGLNGYSYVELPDIPNTASITNGNISATTDNVFYAQEFVGKDYVSDRKFISFAMADLFGTVSQYSSIYALSSVLTGVDYGTLQLLLPVGLNIDELKFDEEDDVGTTRFIPKAFNVSGIGQYNVITSNIDGRITGNNFTGVISGRSISGGKVEIKSTSSDDIVTTNSGVLSNLYINLNNSSESFVGTNNGLITNVLVYGKTSSQYPVSQNNIGRIYQAVSSIVYVPTSAEYTLYGFVEKNGGVITDCYSNSFGYTESHNVFDVYAFAKCNYYYDEDNEEYYNGTISNSYYYIDSWMASDNIAKGYVYDKEYEIDDEVVEGCIISNTYNKKNPSLSKNNKVWITENDHAQIRGIYDKDNRIAVNLKFGSSLTGISEIKAAIETQTEAESDSLKLTTFDYSVNFYENDTTGVSHINVVRITNGNQFIDYINALKTDFIPDNTLILICNDITIAKSFKAFSIPSTSAIVGINSPKITFTGTRKDAIIKTNRGLFGGVIIRNLRLEYKDEAHLDYIFAPIVQNDGFMVNIKLEITTVNGGFTSNVCGVMNQNTGIIYNLVHENTQITSIGNYYENYYRNTGYIYGFTATGLIGSGTKLNGINDQLNNAMQ